MYSYNESIHVYKLTSKLFLQSKWKYVKEIRWSIFPFSKNKIKQVNTHTKIKNKTI